MTIYIQKECLLKAARAFLVFKAVEEFGEILVYNPSSQDIEDEKFDCDFSILLRRTSRMRRLRKLQSRYLRLIRLSVRK